MTQEHINTYISEITSNPRRYRQDYVIFKYLPEFAEYVDSIETQPDRDGLPMPFRQKLWHVINNDLEFQKGICVWQEMQVQEQQIRDILFPEVCRQFKRF